MMWKWYDKMMLMGTMLMAAVLLTACAGEEEDTDGVRMVTAQLNFSLPSRIAGTHHSRTTRMTSDVVQASEQAGEDPDFRGIDDVHLLCFDNYPTQNSTKIGGVIEMKTSGGEVVDDMTEEDYSLCQEISIPVGTSHFGFYARAADAPKNHDERMKYGIIETVGLSKSTYQGNSAIRFRPVPICNSTEPLGGSKRGQALLKLLNDLMNITGPEAAPNDKLSTANNLFLNEAWQRLKTLTTLSSQNMQVMLGFINKLVNQESADDQGKQLAAAITNLIADCCTEPPAPNSDQILLKDKYLGFPADIHLPEGAARITWDETLSEFVVAEPQSYGKSLDVMSIHDYVYPMNLQYQVFSDLLASDEQVLFDEEGNSSSQYDTWEELLEDGYVQADKRVKPSTQSVAMVHQVEYAVGRLALRAQIDRYGTITDANGNYVAVNNSTFTLKAYIVGGQREVDYDFQPVEGSHRYAIYDTELNGGAQSLQRGNFTVPDYILGLGTARDEKICVAMELVNNGDAFQGADGVITTGATFYLVAELSPQDGWGYTSGSLDQVFCKDRATQVDLTIKSLATATYGLPSLAIPKPTVGVSVDMGWGGGFYFEEEL